MFNLKPPHSIFVHADGFLKTAVLLNKPPGTLGFDPFFSVALVTNSAFAIELYLKCLIHIETGKLKKSQHNLRKLFGKLREETQQEIEKQFNALPINTTEYDLSNAPKEAREATESRPRNFRDALKTGAEAFVEWRYLYETDGTSNPYGLFALPWILRNVILARVPAWANWGVQVVKVADALPTSPAPKTPRPSDSTP